MAGFGGGMGGGMNPQALMKALQKFQDLQNELENLRVEGSSGGGMVRATVNGSGQVMALTIDPEVVDPQDVEMLEDLVTSAIHEAQEKAAATSKEKYTPLTGGMKIPGLF